MQGSVKKKSKLQNTILNIHRKIRCWVQEPTTSSFQRGGEKMRVLLEIKNIGGEIWKSTEDNTGEISQKAVKENKEMKKRCQGWKDSVRRFHIWWGREKERRRKKGENHEEEELKLSFWIEKALWLVSKIGMGRTPHQGISLGNVHQWGQRWFWQLPERKQFWSSHSNGQEAG